MARGRMLNRKVATSGKVAAYIEEYGPWAGVFHHRVIAFLDVNGCCRADPYWLKANVLPRASGIDPDACRRFAAGLQKHRLAVLYRVDGMPYLHMPGFRDEQVGLRPDRESPEVPAPEGFDRESGCLPDAFRHVAGNHPAEVEGEVEVEGEGTTTDVPSPDGDSTSEPGARDLKAFHNDAAPLIRKHWWQGDDPPTNGGRDWNMGREFSILDGFVKRGEATPADLLDAIPLARRTFDLSGPITARLFNVGGERQRLNALLAAVRRKREQAAGDPLRKAGAEAGAVMEALGHG